MFHFNFNSANFFKGVILKKNCFQIDSHKFKFTGLLWKYLAFYYNYAYGLFTQMFPVC